MQETELDIGAGANEELESKDGDTKVEPTIKQELRKPKTLDNVTKDVRPLSEDKNQNFDELKSKFERLEMIIKLDKHKDIKDVEIVADLISKGWDLNTLRESKPYLFESVKDSPEEVIRGNTVKRVIAESKSPKSVNDEVTYNDKFVNALISELKIPDFD